MLVLPWIPGRTGFTVSVRARIQDCLKASGPGFQACPLGWMIHSGWSLMGKLYARIEAGSVFPPRCIHRTAAGMQWWPSSAVPSHVYLDGRTLRAQRRSSSIRELKMRSRGNPHFQGNEFCRAFADFRLFNRALKTGIAATDGCQMNFRMKFLLAIGPGNNPHNNTTQLHSFTYRPCPSLLVPFYRSTAGSSLPGFGVEIQSNQFDAYPAEFRSIFFRTLIQCS